MSLAEYRRSLRGKYVSFSLFRQSTDDAYRLIDDIHSKEGVYSGQESAIQFDQEYGDSWPWKIVNFVIILVEYFLNLSSQASDRWKILNVEFLSSILNFLYFSINKFLRATQSYKQLMIISQFKDSS
jgi:hypothetical protein